MTASRSSLYVGVGGLKLLDAPCRRARWDAVGHLQPRSPAALAAGGDPLRTAPPHCPDAHPVPAPPPVSFDFLQNEQGNRTTPSYVAFTDTERLVGDAAKNQVAMNPINTVFDAKRLIGRKFSDPTIQHDISHWPFKVIAGPGDKPLIQGERVFHFHLRGVEGGFAVARA